MNKKHLFWIIPATLIVGFFMGAFLVANGISFIMQSYPIIDCVYTMDDALNVQFNKLPFTVESQRKAIEWRCAKEHVDFNATYDSIFEYTERGD